MSRNTNPVCIIFCVYLTNLHDVSIYVFKLQKVSPLCNLSTNKLIFIGYCNDVSLSMYLGVCNSFKKMTNPKGIDIRIVCTRCVICFCFLITII